jgi:hypothetical protein
VMRRWVAASSALAGAGGAAADQSGHRAQNPTDAPMLPCQVLLLVVLYSTVLAS